MAVTAAAQATILSPSVPFAGSQGTPLQVNPSVLTPPQFNQAAANVAFAFSPAANLALLSRPAANVLLTEQAQQSESRQATTEQTTTSSFSGTKTDGTNKNSTNTLPAFNFLGQASASPGLPAIGASLNISV